jgi:hypothetical protein
MASMIIKGGVKKKKSMKTKGYRAGGKVKSKGYKMGGKVKAKGYRMGGRIMKPKGMKNGGAVDNNGNLLTPAQKTLPEELQTAIKKSKKK